MILIIPFPKTTIYSYKILNPKAVDELKDTKEPKKIAQVILDAVQLDAENYRLGNTKA
jgi:myosin heavy subunit